MPPRPDDKYLKLRLRPELHANILERAWLNRRSINAEVVLLLEVALTLPLEITEPTAEQKLLAQEEMKRRFGFGRELREAVRQGTYDQQERDIRRPEKKQISRDSRHYGPSIKSLGEDFTSAQHSMSYVAPQAKPGVVTPQHTSSSMSEGVGMPADLWDDIPPGVEPPPNPLQGVPARMMFQDDTPSAQEMQDAQLTPEQMRELVDMYRRMKAIIEPSTSPSPSPVAAKKKAPPRAKPGPKARR